MFQRGRRLARDDRGASSLELAILGPAVIAMTFISVQFALWYHAKNVAQAAAEAGARASREYQATDSDGVQQARQVFGQLGGPKVTDGGVSVTPSRTATTVTIKLDGRSIALLPGLNIPIHVTAGGPIEQFVPAP
jgi:Flp pilus assembly protein TadG